MLVSRDHAVARIRLPFVTGSGVKRMLGPTWESPDEVHVWHVPISSSVSLDDGLEVLGDDERARATRFRYDADRSDYVQRRAFLRGVLASYIGGSPARVRLVTTRQGRPVLDGPRTPSFSLSHTSGLAVVAVTPARAVGVDVERVRPVSDALDLARRTFTPREADWLGSARRTRLDELFLTLWTRKESYVKALGTGLSTPLRGFEVWQSDGYGNGRPQGPSGVLPFSFATLEPLEGHVATVTAAGRRLTVRTMAP